MDDLGRKWARHTWYLSIFLHEQNFWRIKFTPKKCVNYDKIHRKLPINLDDVIEGLWTNDFVFVFIHRWFFELPIVITFLFTMIRTCKAMSTPETLKKLCLNLRCQRNALLLGKVSISLTSITSTHFWQFWESWLTQTLPAVLRLSKQNERLASDDYTMCVVCPCDPPQPRIFLDIPLAVLDSFLGYFVHRSRIPFYVSLYRSDCRPGKNPNRT